MQNHFELFHLPQRFAIDVNALDRAYHDVQGQVHPDRFVNATEAERRVAMQWATRANEAYQTLRNPFKRAAYLCEINGIDLETESNTSMPRAFLVQQMEWRESLDDARGSKDPEVLEALATEVQAARRQQVLDIGILLDKHEFQGAAKGVRQLMFLEKFGEEVSNAVDAMED